MALPLLPISELLTGTEPPVDWLVPEFIPRGSLIALAGEPGAGKSLLMYVISVALASGTPFLGWRASGPHRVLYFDQENSKADCTQYLRWAWNGLGRPDPRLLDVNLAFAHIVLGGPTWGATAEQYVRAVQPELIVIDTTTPACNVLDENDNAEATRAVQQIRRLHGLCAPSPAIVALKHAKVRAEGGGHTLRGAKAWEGMVDSIVYHTKARGKTRSDGLRATKLSPAKTRAFGLRSELVINPSWTPDHSGLILRRGVELRADESEDDE